MKILYEDSYLAVVEKPQNMPSQPDKSGDDDVVSLLSLKTGYAAIINRLDRVVGGAVLIAYNKQSAALLSDQLENGITKEYTAVVCGNPKEEAALTDWLIKNGRQNITKVVNKTVKGSVCAKLIYKKCCETVTEEFGSLSLLNITLLTGRHHQIRAQLSYSGIPIWGDTKYNTNFNKGGNFYKAALNLGIGIQPALWSHKISFTHPKTGERVSAGSLPPDSYPFNRFLIP